LLAFSLSLTLGPSYFTCIARSSLRAPSSPGGFYDAQPAEEYDEGTGDKEMEEEGDWDLDDA
jgi:hypothetical protein